MGLLQSSEKSKKLLINGKTGKLIFNNIHSNIPNKIKIKKHIEKYANLNFNYVKLNVTSLKKVNGNLICMVKMKVKKGSNVTEEEYKKYLNDDVNGPFEDNWDNSPLNDDNFKTPTLIYNK